MTQHWITYSVDTDTGRRRRGRGRWWWPWNWRWPRRNRPRVVRINRPRRANNDRRRKAPWLLLLLPLLLLLIPLSFFLINNSAEETVVSNPGGGSGGLDPSTGSTAGSTAGSGPANRNAPLSIDDPPGDNADNAGDAVLSIPNLPSIQLDGDMTFLDLGDLSCQQEQRYVLVSNGKAHTIKNLDDETMAAFYRSDMPINTVAMSAHADIAALETIAQRTGGAFTNLGNPPPSP